MLFPDQEKGFINKEGEVEKHLVRCEASAVPREVHGFGTGVTDGLQKHWELGCRVNIYIQMRCCIASPSMTQNQGPCYAFKSLKNISTSLGIIHHVF